MNADELLVVKFLSANPVLFFAAREVSRKADHRKRFEEEGNWAQRVLTRLKAQGVVEANQLGHYRMTQPPEEDPKERAKLFGSKPHS